MSPEVIKDFVVTLGIPLTLLLLLVYLICKFGIPAITNILNRILDENKEREDRNSKTLQEISCQMQNIAEVSKSVSETNRLMTEKLSFEMQDLTADMKKVLDKLDKGE